ncbi:hypothetical protein GCM10023257_53490 [Streptomyces hyderabadensis]|uniref:Uncharacterized protein n=1 Tax=Streptomyces hyderabadensis TaxID=598549 RepID=A0ABP9IN55_9ACTN
MAGAGAEVAAGAAGQEAALSDGAARAAVEQPDGREGRLRVQVALWGVVAPRAPARGARSYGRSWACVADGRGRPVSERNAPTAGSPTRRATARPVGPGR